MHLSTIRYRLQDKLSGYTTPDRCFRKDYKKSARRVLARSLRSGLLTD